MKLNPESLARASSRHPWRVIVVWILLVVGMGAASQAFLADSLTTDIDFTNRPESKRAMELIEGNVTGEQQDTEFFIVEHDTLPVADPTFEAYVRGIQQEIIGLGDGVIAGDVVTVYDLNALVAQTGNPVQQGQLRAQAEGLVSVDGRGTLIAVPIVDMEIETVEKLKPIAEENGEGFRVLLAGPATLNADTTKIAEEDLQRSEMIGIAIALVVLLVVFAALIAALLPLAMALVAIPIAFGTLALIAAASGVHFSIFTQNIATSIGLAVGIDYSLFIIARYREERKKGFDPYGAIVASGATASRAVFFSGLTVVLALMGMFIMPVTIFRSMAAGAIFVVVASIAASLTLLPALMGLLKDRINWPRLSKRARMEGEHDPKGGFWDRLTKTVMARPVVFLLLSVAILGGLASLYFTIDKGTTQSAASLPDEVESKQAFIILSEDFAAGGRTDPVQVYVGGFSSPQVRSAATELQRAIQDDPAFADEAPLQPSSAGDAAVVNAIPVGDPFDTYQPIVFAFVLGLSFLLLMVVFRSVVVPLKAVIMNLLSVGAAYGAIVLVFQQQSNAFLNAIHEFALDFFNLIGFQFQEVESIEAWLPLLLFSILFGLSMDYHVFLLSRIREEYDKSGDNTEAVAYGLRTTAGIITGAALIMVAVFTAFAAGRLVPLQQMGLGLAVAVFMDATIVRSILVPSSMKLLGDLNWYLPKWLEWLPKVNVEGHEPEREPVVVEEPEVVGASEER
jgi:RND superfamily putative drug exporter